LTIDTPESRHELTHAAKKMNSRNERMQPKKLFTTTNTNYIKRATKQNYHRNHAIFIVVHQREKETKHKRDITAKSLKFGNNHSL